MIIDSELLQSRFKDLLFRAAPEKEDDTTELLESNDIIFQKSDGEENKWQFDMSAGMYRYVSFNDQALAVFWSGAFVAWKAYVLASELEQATLNVIADHSKLFTDPDYDLVKVKADLDSAAKSIDFNKLSPELDFVESVKITQAKKVEDVNWTKLIPEMGSLCTDNIQNQAAGELAHLALAWALLHEIHHIHLQRQGAAAELDDKQGCHKEEFECDKFAFDYLTSDINNASNITPGSDEYRMLFKRELGAMFALFSMVVLSKGCWDETDTHPKLHDRLDRIFNLLCTDEARHISKNMFLVLQSNVDWSNCPSI